MSARAADVREVLRAAVADGDRAVAVQQQHGHRLADDVRTADHHALLALGVDAVFVDQLHHARGRAGDEVKVAHHDFADIDRMERVHVLFGVDRVDDRLLGDVVRHRQLAQDARDLRAPVQLVDQAEQLVLRGLGRQGVFLAVKSALGARFLLVAHIDLAGGVVAHDDDREPGRDALLFQFRGLVLNARAHLGRKRLAVHSDCTHVGCPPCCRWYVWVWASGGSGRRGHTLLDWFVTKCREMYDTVAGSAAAQHFSTFSYRNWIAILLVTVRGALKGGRDGAQPKGLLQSFIRTSPSAPDGAATSPQRGGRMGSADGVGGHAGARDSSLRAAPSAQNNKAL